ncbi:MAG: tail fiber domain-containing protein, partial [Polyangiaceae bacterium]
VSSRKHKDGIEYVDDEELERLHDETLRIQLATYNYKAETADPAPRHLGFVIEDMPQATPAVGWSRERVDLYGYVSMVVATMQVQEKEIAELRRELEATRVGASK